MQQPSRRTIVWLGAAVVIVALLAWFVTPKVRMALNTISTDDAYVNGHVTLVAPRVAGQVARVLVDDNVRVKKGDLLVELDKEPYQVQVDISQAAVVAAQADLQILYEASLVTARHASALDGYYPVSEALAARIDQEMEQRETLAS